MAKKKKTSGSTKGMYGMSWNPGKTVSKVANTVRKAGQAYVKPYVDAGKAIGSAASRAAAYAAKPTGISPQTWALYMAGSPLSAQQMANLANATKKAVNR